MFTSWNSVGICTWGSVFRLKRRARFDWKPGFLRQRTGERHSNLPFIPADNLIAIRLTEPPRCLRELPAHAATGFRPNPAALLERARSMGCPLSPLPFRHHRSISTYHGLGLAYPT